MTSATSKNRAEVKRTFGPEGFQPPPHVFRELPLPAKMPRDLLGQELALLIADHPELGDEFQKVSIEVLTDDSRLALLNQIKSRLGIQPIRSRRLAYVGPTPSNQSHHRHPRPTKA